MNAIDVMGRVNLGRRLISIAQAKHLALKMFSSQQPRIAVQIACGEFTNARPDDGSLRISQVLESVWISTLRPMHFLLRSACIEQSAFLLIELDHKLPRFIRYNPRNFRSLHYRHAFNRFMQMAAMVFVKMDQDGGAP